jgi:tetrahydromethanopterin S-methyltransferase subunit G
VSAFEFFFSFYGLVLGLSLAVIATGLATAIQHRRKVRIGWLTPVLALFVVLDVASFWDFAWTVFRDVPFSYGLLVASLVVAVVYFIAASLVFPHQIEDGMSLDDHFFANKKVVLLLTTAANVLALLVAAPILAGKPTAAMLMMNYGSALVFYVALVVPAAFIDNRKVFAWLTGIHIGIYLFSAIITAAMPDVMDKMAQMPSPPAATATAQP